jgi:hypothetical protein
MRRGLPETGWASKRNGELLALAAVDFDVFLTTDRNRSYQQNLSALDIAAVVLVAPSNRRRKHFSFFLANKIRRIATLRKHYMIRA